MDRKCGYKDWGHFDISECNGIDNRSKFLLWLTKTALLYMCASFDEYHLLSFTCSKLPVNLIANTDHEPKVSKLKNDDSKKLPADKLATQVGAVGQSMKRLANVELTN